MSDSRPTGPTTPPTTPTGASASPAASPATTSGAPHGKARGKATGSPDDPLRRSRTSGLWVGVIAAGLLLILLIIFIVQNTQTVTVKFLGWTGTPPLAAALLVATAAGILVTALVGSLRILQLRRRVKRLSK